MGSLWDTSTAGIDLFGANAPVVSGVDYGGGNYEASGGFVNDYLSPLLNTWLTVEKWNLQKDLARAPATQQALLETPTRDSQPGAVPVVSSPGAALVQPLTVQTLLPWMMAAGLVYLAVR